MPAYPGSTVFGLGGESTIRGDSSWKGEVILSVRAFRPGVPRDEADDAEWEGIIAVLFAAGEGLDDAEGDERPLVPDRCFGMPGRSGRDACRIEAGDAPRMGATARGRVGASV